MSSLMFYEFRFRVSNVNAQLKSAISNRPNTSDNEINFFLKEQPMQRLPPKMMAKWNPSKNKDQVLKWIAFACVCVGFLAHYFMIGLFAITEFLLVSQSRPFSQPLRSRQLWTMLFRCFLSLLTYFFLEFFYLSDVCLKQGRACKIIEVAVSLLKWYIFLYILLKPMPKTAFFAAQELNSGRIHLQLLCEVTGWMLLFIYALRSLRQLFISIVTGWCWRRWPDANGSGKNRRPEGFWRRWSRQWGV